jgi:hypothetical protein
MPPAEPVNSPGAGPRRGSFMAKTIIAHSAQETTTRLERGQKLFEERYNEIEHLEGDVWSVPSGNLLAGAYLVRLGDRPACECKDFEFRHVQCYHQITAREADSKSRTCACCRNRVLGRFLSEVTEEDGLLSWYVGDEICRDCIKRGFWA